MAVWRVVALGLTLFGGFGCDQETNQPPVQKPKSKASAAASHSVEEQLRHTCERGKKSGRPVLLEFTASWCGDCQRLKELKREPAAKSELRNWAELSVDIGSYDRHPQLLQAFEVTAIAKWVALAPTDCSQPVSEWPRLDARIFEPLASERTIGSREIAEWLRQARL